MKANEFYCANCNHVVMALTPEESEQLRELLARNNLAWAEQRIAEEKTGLLQH